MVCIFILPFYFLLNSYFLYRFWKKIWTRATYIYDKDQLYVDTTTSFTTTHRFDAWQVVVTRTRVVEIRNKVFVTITRSDTSKMKVQHKVLLKSVVVHSKLYQHRWKMVVDRKLRWNVEFRTMDYLIDWKVMHLYGA